MVEIIQKTTQEVEYKANSDTFVPCCAAWKNEFGKQIRSTPDGSGFFPAKVFVSDRKINKIVTRPLRLPWLFCPFCGTLFTITIVTG